jgi:hypothetical protein
MGLDPIWRSKPSEFVVSSESMLLKAAFQKNLTIEERKGSKVTVAGHDVDYDYDRRLWFADIVVDTPSYFPFIRLALARYQPHSIPDAHLSRIVTANFIQLAPDRFASVIVDQKSGVANVTVTGRTYSKVDGRVGPSKVDVTIERRRPEVTDDFEELGWIANGPAQVLSPFVQNQNEGTWSGSIQLPSDHQSTRYRLVIREYELILNGKIFIGGIKLKGQRLVYADTIEV